MSEKRTLQKGRISAANGNFLLYYVKGDEKTNELVYLKNEESVCDSSQVAEQFGKRHDVVFRNTENAISDMDSETAKLWFQKSIDKSQDNNKSYPENR